MQIILETKLSCTTPIDTRIKIPSLLELISANSIMEKYEVKLEKRSSQTQSK